MRRKLIVRSLITGASVFMISAGGAMAAKTPDIRVSNTNQVPACVTPQRLMEFVETRNKRIAPKFGDVAAYYQAHGNNLGIRWDYAFFQMLVETNYLKFRAPSGRMGDVKPRQNNFAGLGATGGGVAGDSFKTVSDGVLGHLQHIQMYSGHRVANPVSDRTRKIQEWDLILPWAQAFGREVSFTDLTTKWSPGDRGYSNDIEYTARKFRSLYCGGPGRIHTAQLPQTSKPSYQLAAKASVPAVQKKTATGNSVAFTSSTISKAGTDIKVRIKAAEKLAEKKIAAAEKRAETERAIAAAAEKRAETEKAIAAAAKKRTETEKTVTAANSAQSSTNIPGTNAAAKCAVWTASYGGGKSLLIRSTVRGMVNYTALVVHEGQESREAEAYIKAWAKGGKAIGEFGSSDKALNRAYELCPQS